jgi:tRNA1Val (adenine37-N6)-methyltransferase
MPEEIFRFKQFNVNQAGATLKVCTDSCLFGAWVARNASGKNVLDIGTGTGLLALMYAQQHPDSALLGLEIEPHTAKLAENNFIQSPWVGRLKVLCTSLQDYVQTNQATCFDVIICNPPFFENQLSSGERLKNIAKHSTQLSRTELIASISQLLAENGTAYVLLPPYEAEMMNKTAQNMGFFLQEKVTVINRANAQALRQMLAFGKTEKPLNEEELIIYAEEKHYSPAFVELLREYYLDM